MIQELLHWMVEVIHSWGYWGIFITTFMESTFVPLPSEVTVIPVGYLIQQGRFDAGLAFACTIAGTLSGSLFSYGLAYYLGRPLLLKYKRYLFMNDAKIKKMDGYFEKHGGVSIFICRFIPGIRHIISFPAGLAKMNLPVFCFFTGLGGGLWMTILLSLGYFIGEQQELLTSYLHEITLALFGFIAIVGLAYLVVYRASQTRTG